MYPGNHFARQNCRARVNVNATHDSPCQKKQFSKTLILYSITNSTSEVPVLAIFTYTPVFLSFRLFCNLALAARRCSMAAGLAATAVRWQQQQASLNSEIRTWIPSWPQMRSKFVPVLEYKTTSMNPRSTVRLLALLKNCIMGDHTGVLNWRYI